MEKILKRAKNQLVLFSFCLSTLVESSKSNLFAYALSITLLSGIFGSVMRQLGERLSVDCDKGEKAKKLDFFQQA